MRMAEMPIEGQLPIDGYGPGGFRVGGEWHDGALMIDRNGVHPLPQGVDDAVIAAVAERREIIDVVLVGQGPDIAPFPHGFRDRLEEAGIGFEHMATPAACRTYNVMLSEERRVAVLLIPI